MLGNFSFGDYFKREAIHWAWEFLTDKKWLGLDPKRLTVTVYLDDDEAADIWHDEIRPPGRPHRADGRGRQLLARRRPEPRPRRRLRAVQRDLLSTARRRRGGRDLEPRLHAVQPRRRPAEQPRPLPSKNIDTGMGLEAHGGRPARRRYQLPHRHSSADRRGGRRSRAASSTIPADDNGRRLRRIADHVRACTFASTKTSCRARSEKYVIRRLLRRAVLDGYQMGCREPFLYKLVPVVAELMKGPYPELERHDQRVQKVIKAEETTFFRTIDAGLNRIQKMFDDMRRPAASSCRGTTRPSCIRPTASRPRWSRAWRPSRTSPSTGPAIVEAMEEHGEKSGKIADVVFTTGPLEALKKALNTTEFLGYETTEAPAEILGIIAQNHLLDDVTEVGHDESGAGGPRSDALLRRDGRPGRRHGRIVGDGFRIPRHRHAKGRRPDRSLRPPACAAR